MSGLIDPVTNEAALNADMTAMAGIVTPGSYTITLGADFLLGSDIEAINLHSGVTLTVDGAGNTVNGAGLYRGFLVYAGTVTIENLDLAGTAAIGGAGGLGFGGGGGGAGLGGGVFVAAGGNVTLSGVSMIGDIAKGGAGGAYNIISGDGGGGGMGGAGGNSTLIGGVGYGGGGGGGIGVGASGGGGTAAAGAGIVPGVSAGGSGNTGTPGGGQGGGGGAGALPTASSIGGGGGIGAGAEGSGQGGFGGGGGGSFHELSKNGGAGGFGGGGGAGGVNPANVGGSGGFGGGGGSGYAGGGSGGVGGGAGGNRAGGGGLGAGGDIFVQQGGVLVIQAGTLQGGTVEAGAAGTGGTGQTAGSAAGSGLFLEGTQTVTLAPGAGQTLTIGDTIADESFAIVSGDTNEAGLIIGAGRVRLMAANQYNGITTIEPGGTLELGVGTSAGENSMAFGAPGGGLGQEVVFDSYVTDNLVIPADHIGGFTPSDTIDLTQLPWLPGGRSLTYAARGQLEIGNSPSTDILIVTGTVALSTGEFRLEPDATGGTLVELACFAAGTRILTASGERAVEDVRAGDALPDVITQCLRCVVWTGCKTVFPADHARPADALPVRVRAGAFGPGMPHRDLVLSPEHCLLRDGLLVPVRRLIDGRRIVREQVDSITYWHIELDAHGVLLAEGLPAESYLDCGDRAGFAIARREARGCALLG